MLKLSRLICFMAIIHFRINVNDIPENNSHSACWMQNILLDNLVHEQYFVTITEQFL